MKALVYGVRPLGWATCKWLKLLWPGCLLSRLNGLSLRELDPPDLPGEDWVRCRPILAGICGSDLSILAQRQPPDSFLQSFSTLPAVMGHENVSVVTGVGSAVDPSWVGRRVCVDPALCCRVRGVDPPCPACRAGHYGACESFAAGALPPGSCLGFCAPVGGSWSESFVAHVSQLIEPPAHLTDEQAVLTDPLACSLHAVGRVDMSRAEHVLVYGAGILGLGVVWALRAVGFDGRIDVIARHEHQGRLARQLGAGEVLYLPADAAGRFQAIRQRTGGRVTRARFGSYMLSGGYDVVFECVGRTRPLQDAVKWTRSRGQLVMLGTGHGRGADLTSVWFGELTVLGASGRGVEDFRGRRMHTYQLVHELLAESAADVSGLLTHTFALEQYKTALSVAFAKGPNRSVKVAFRLPPAGGEPSGSEGPAA